VRRTQEERSAETRARLLDATLECLIDVGYARTTTTMIADRAGVSRGAQVHHFPTKSALVLDAVGHLAARQAQELRRRAQELPASGDRLSLLVELVWESFSGPLFYAALELWVAARTDPALHRSLYGFERRLGRGMAELWRDVAGGLAEAPRFEEILDLTLHLARGMAVQKILRQDDRARRRLLEVWKQMSRAHLEA
jgi:AcrR family transcriptional regulator